MLSFFVRRFNNVFLVLFNIFVDPIFRFIRRRFVIRRSDDLFLVVVVSEHVLRRIFLRHGSFESVFVIRNSTRIGDVIHVFVVRIRACRGLVFACDVIERISFIAGSRSGRRFVLDLNGILVDVFLVDQPRRFYLK